MKPILEREGGHQRGFAQYVNKESSLEWHNYIQAEQTDLLCVNAKDFIQSERI